MAQPPHSPSCSHTYLNTEKNSNKPKLKTNKQNIPPVTHPYCFCSCPYYILPLGLTLQDIFYILDCLSCLREKVSTLHTAFSIASAITVNQPNLALTAGRSLTKATKLSSLIAVVNFIRRIHLHIPFDSTFLYAY